VVQETFLAGVKGLERFDGRVDIKYWLRGILRNKIVDYIRKAVRERPVEDIESYEPPDSIQMKVFGIPTSTPRPWDFDIHQAFDEKEFWQVFESCVSKLKGPIQQAFVLKELEGMSTDEICKVLGITPNNLWVMIHRARGRLKDCLNTHWNR
jgi:RNA polymerase sigma-70 factor (ECF subfamily)